MSNKKGNILQIILIIFMNLMFFLSFFITKSTNEYKLANQINIMINQQKYEIMLIYYFKDQIANSLLISDEVEYDNYIFKYDVEVTDDIYHIVISSSHPDFLYTIECEINITDLRIKKFDYI